MDSQYKTELKIPQRLDRHFLQIFELCLKEGKCLMFILPSGWDGYPLPFTL